MSVSDPRHCPECGSDTYFAQNFERVRDKGHALEARLIEQAKRFAVERAQWELSWLEHSDEHKALQRKVHKQRLVINRLEAKLRKLGKQPHGQEGAQGESS